MVSITFRLSEIGRIEIPLAESEKWAAVIERCTTLIGVEPGAILAVRKGTVLREQDFVEDGDEIDVFPAISGG